MALEHLPGDAPADSIIAAIRRDGAAIVENFVSQEIVSQVLADLREPFDAVGRSTENDFNGYTTLRVNSVLDLSDASVEVVGHRRMMEVLDAFLLGHAQSYLMGSCTAIEIHPGEQDQALHRDDTIYPVHLPGMELQMSVMWALTEFTEENGATRVVPGSHRWVFPREPGPDDEVVQAPMTPGSALFYLGSAFHGGGANNANAPRAGLVNTYCLGWLRQEENQYLTLTREEVAAQSDEMRRMLGFQAHGPFLGVWPEDPDGKWYET